MNKNLKLPPFKNRNPLHLHRRRQQSHLLLVPQRGAAAAPQAQHARQTDAPALALPARLHQCGQHSAGHRLRHLARLATLGRRLRSLRAAVADQRTAAAAHAGQRALGVRDVRELRAQRRAGGVGRRGQNGGRVERGAGDGGDDVSGECRWSTSDEPTGNHRTAPYVPALCSFHAHLCTTHDGRHRVTRTR